MSASSLFYIKNFSEVSEKYKIDVAVIAVPAKFAQEVLEQITNSGIKAVMNFAPIPLRGTGDVKIKSVDLTISLESLSYFLAKPNNQNGKNVKPNAPQKRIKK